MHGVDLLLEHDDTIFLTGASFTTTRKPIRSKKCLADQSSTVPEH